MYSKEDLKQYIAAHYEPVESHFEWSAIHLGASPLAERAEKKKKEEGFCRVAVPKLFADSKGNAANGTESFDSDERTVCVQQIMLASEVTADEIPPAARTARKPQKKETPYGELDESFREALIRIIGEKGISDAECYKKAEIDRRLFNKIINPDRNGNEYRPGKKTVLSLAIALELPLEEAQNFVKRAGFSLSKSILSDVIVMYFIENGIFDVAEINGALEEKDQQPLRSYN